MRRPALLHSLKWNVAIRWRLKENEAPGQRGGQQTQNTTRLEAFTQRWHLINEKGLCVFSQSEANSNQRWCYWQLWLSPLCLLLISDLLIGEQGGREGRKDGRGGGGMWGWEAEGDPGTWINTHTHTPWHPSVQQVCDVRPNFLMMIRLISSPIWSHTEFFEHSEIYILNMIHQWLDWFFSNPNESEESVW